MLSVALPLVGMNRWKSKSIIATALLFVMYVLLMRTQVQKCLTDPCIPKVIVTESTMSTLNYETMSNDSQTAITTTITKATTLATHTTTAKNVTGLTTSPTESEAHVGGKRKQSLSTLPSIPADMPFPTHIKSREELQKTECVLVLYNFLLSVDKSVSPHVNMVFGDSEHAHLVMNWIIAAMLRLEPPLHNVVVISLDRRLCDNLAAKKLPLTCIVVSVESIFVWSVDQQIDWRRRMMVRQPVLRLITYWGYDVAAYDSDAVLLHNPQPLYDERPHVNLFAASEAFPPEVAKVWGFTNCAGTLILRSSPSIESLWSKIYTVTTTSLFDQKSWNHALRDMDIQWKKKTDVKKLCSERYGWESEGPLKIFVLPPHQFCRNCCLPSMSYKTLYVVHPNSGQNVMTVKEDQLRKMRAWFLKHNWKDLIKSSLTGLEWLRNLSTL